MTTLRFDPAGYATLPAEVALPVSRVNPLVRMALYLYVLSIPFEIPQRPMPLEVPTITGFIFLGAVVLSPGAAFGRIPSALAWFALHLWIVAIASIAAGGAHVGEILRHFAGLVQVVLLFWACANLLGDARVLRGVLMAAVFATAVRAGLQVLGIATSQYREWTGGVRVTVLGQNANLSAIILSAGLVMLVGLRALRGRGLPQAGLLTWPLAGLMGFAIIQTGSRGGLLCALCGLAVLSLTGATPAQKLRNAVLGVFTLVLLGWGAMRSDVMRHRFEAAEGGNLAGRERIYPAAIDLFLERPLLGWGAIENQFEVARRIGERVRPSRDVHNLVLELLTTSGVFGALAFLTGLALVMRGAWRSRRGPLGMLPLAVLVCVLVGTVSGTWLPAKILWLAFALATAADLWWSDTAPPPMQELA